MDKVTMELVVKEISNIRIEAMHGAFDKIGAMGRLIGKASPATVLDELRKRLEDIQNNEQNEEIRRED